MVLYSRRQLLKNTAALAGLTALGSLGSVFAGPGKGKYKIGVCDWSIGKHSDISALAYAQKLGLDGVQVSLGKVENNMHLRQPEVREAYRKATQESGVAICSLAIGEMNRVPYKSAPETEEWVSDSIDAAKAMGCKVVLLAFFDKGDLKGDVAGTREVISRLKKVAPKAEKAGVILGIESWLSADEHLEIIHGVGSGAVRVYYDVANSHKMGYDIYGEMRRLGSEYICEVHAKENGYLLGKGKIDFPKVKQILDEMNYAGWVVLEGARPEGDDLFESYTANTRYLRSIFDR